MVRANAWSKLCDERKDAQVLETASAFGSTIQRTRAILYQLEYSSEKGHCDRKNLVIRVLVMKNGFQIRTVLIPSYCEHVKSNHAFNKFRSAYSSRIPLLPCHYVNFASADGQPRKQIPSYTTDRVRSA